MPDLMAHFGEYRPDPGWTFYHGTPDVRGWEHGAHYGIHVGTEEAARQALHAKIGEPAEGTWDGTREYGKTLLKGQRPGLRSGYNMEPRPDHYPRPATYHEPVRQPGGGWGHGPPVSFGDREPGKVYNHRGAVYSDESPVPMDARPSIFPVRITGPMTNHPSTPHDDWKANGYMSAALKRGHARRGYFYRNVSEDEGSISAVVPSADHLERLDVPKTASLIEHFGAWHEGPHYHGTKAELQPGDLITPGTHPPTMPDPDIRGEKADQPREHTYFSPRQNYVTEHYGPNVYEVEPTGDYRHDPEYGWQGGSRYMYRSKEPLRVKRKVSTDWGLPHEGLLEHMAAWYHGTNREFAPGEHIEPGHEPVWEGSSPEHVYFTDDPDAADTWAETAAAMKESGHPRTYQVEPTGQHEEDPEYAADDIGLDARRSRHPLRVVRKISLLEHFGAAPLCHYCHEPLDQEDIDNESSSHEDCWDMHQCPVHGEHEDDPVLAEQHRDTYTDWYHHLPFAGGIHRGLVKQLPREVHDAVHDESRPSAERAQALRGYLHREGFHGGTQEEQPYGADHEGHLGVHWTPSETMAKSWGSDDMYEGPVGGGPKPSVTHVVLHAASPDEEHIETDPDHLEARHMYGFEHERSEHEVPLKYGAPVHLTGISWKHGGQEHWHRHDFAGPSRHMAAAGDEGFANPYHGTEQFGGRPEFSRTWFHGTRGTDPEFREQYREGHTGSEPRMSQPPDERAMHSGWPQPNKMIGVHLTPLHRVAHRFAKGVYPSKTSPGIPSALVHARLHFDSPAHYPTEKHLNLAVAAWAQRSYPHWHNDKLNQSQAWNYSDTEGTHRDFRVQHPYKPGGTFEENRDFTRQASQAQQILQWHPHLPEIMEGFRRHLENRGHHGITYGNEVEGPGMGGYEGEHDKEFADHTSQDVRHISAIATRPSQIETTHVEHIAAPKTEPQPHEVESSPTEPQFWGENETWEHGKHGYSSDLNEDKPMYDRVGAFHAQHGGAYPGHARTAAGKGPTTQPSVYYHGTAARLRPGDLIEPGHKGHGVSSREHVYLSATDSVARTFGGLAAVRNKAKTYSIYQVEPTGPTEPDPDGMGHRSRHPLRVVNLYERGASPEDPNPWWNQPGTGKGYPKQAAAGQALYHSGGKDFPGDEEWVHLGTRAAALNRAGDWHEERARRGEPAAQAYLHTVHMAGSHYPSERSDSEANDPVWRDITARSGHTVLPYLNEYEDPGTVSYLAHRSAVRLLRTEPLPHGKQAKIIDMASSDGDEFYECAKGHDHWGAHGAAGLLIRHRGEDGQQRYLLQKRSPYSDEPNTWSVPGGAIGEHESPEDGAWREAREEMGSIPRHVTHHHTVTSTDCGDWKYHTVVADAGEHFMPRGNGETEYETAGVGWHTADEIEDLRKGGDLHPAFARSWDAVRRSRGPKTAAASYRLWRGEGPHGEAPVSEGSAGRWFTPDRITAEDYAYQNKGHLYHLDVTAQDKPHIASPDLVWDGIRRGGAVTVLADEELAARKEHHAEGCPSCDPGHDETHRHQREWVARQEGKTAAADSRDQVVRMHPRDLMPYVERYRTEDPGGVRHRQNLAESIRQKGYQPRLHGGMSGDTHHWPPSSPITLVHQDDHSFFLEGNHRVHALNDAGYDKPVPVLVKDRRTAKTAAQAWQTGHRPERGPALHEMAGHPDIDLDYASYSGPRHDVRSVIERARGKPDEPVTIYRAGGPLHAGDWASLTPHFPRDFRPGEQVHELTVPAKHVRHAYSDYLDEVGYFPDKTAVLHPDPPDWAHGMQSGGSQVEWVRREKLKPYMEFHHDRETGQSTYLPTGHTFPDRYDTRRWDEMDQSVAEKGMHEPVLLEYNPWTRKMHIGEGHHRLESAERAGHTHVPVWGLKTSREHEHAKPVPGEPKVRPEHFAGGYFPSSFKPSDVLPADWVDAREPKTAVITPGSLPPEQQAAFDADDHREHRSRMLEVARHPPPGTRVWRGEIRGSGEDPQTAESAGMHWSASPDPIITGWAHEGQKHVVWQGVVENHEEQAFPRSHPIWSGRHQSFDHEAEVRFRPGAQVKLEGAYVHQPKEYPGGLATTPGHLVPRVPERTHPDWTWHPLDRHITIRHAGQGASDYEHLGIPREAGRQLPVTEIGPLYHGTTQERAGRILEHGFEGGTVHLTPHADLAGSYAAGRVTKDKGGAPAVLKIERVRGVSASETGYMDPGKSRASGADYQDKGPEVVVLNPAAIHGITRHAAAGPFYHGTNAELAEGDQVRSSWREPRHEPGKIYPDQFFTTDTAEAARYGKNVYQVEPEGAYEPDESRPRSWLSRQPLRVIRRHAAADPAMVP